MYRYKSHGTYNRLVQFARRPAGPFAIGTLMAVPTAFFATLHMFLSPVFGIATLPLAVLASVYLFFRWRRAQRANMWHSRHQREEERQSFVLDMLLCIAFIETGVINGLLLFFTLFP